MKFYDPSISRELFELKTSNLARRLITGGTNDKNEKSRSKWARKVSRDLLLEFWDPFISRERLELKTSNLACRLSTGGTNDKNETLGQIGSGRGHMTYCLLYTSDAADE